MTSNPLVIEESDITFPTPRRPFNITGGSGDLFVGYHATAGKVAVKRLRLSTEMTDEEDVVRVSTLLCFPTEDRDPMTVSS